MSGPTSAPGPDGRDRLIEVGLLLVDRTDGDGRDPVMDGRARAMEFLRSCFPEFEWRMPVLQRLVVNATGRVEPTELLDEGVHERSERHWDFAIVVTQSDLESYYRPYAVAAPSRAVSVAVLSTSRLFDPLVHDDGTDPTAQPAIGQRVAALIVHLIADLNGVPHCPHPNDYTYAPRSPSDLDGMQGMCRSRRDQLVRELADVADTRLEEVPMAARSGVITFYVRAIWINSDDILSAVLRARPWEFPLRLGRVTAAAMSTLVILMLTAEVWELGARQSVGLVTGMAAIALFGASGFVLKRHRLLLVRGGAARTEQIVTTNTAMSLVVFLGMLTTYTVVWVAALLLSAALFDTPLVRRWTTLDAPASRFLFATFVSSIGILIGALGSTFEGRYFRHVAFVDEET